MRENDLRSHRRPSEYISELAARHGFDETSFWRAVDIYDVLNIHDSDAVGQSDLMVAQLQRDAYGCSAVLAFLPPFVNAMSMSTFDMRIGRFVGVETLLLPLIRRQSGVAWLDHRDKTGEHAKVCSMIRTRLTPNDESTKVIELEPEFPPCEFEIMLSKWYIYVKIALDSSVDSLPLRKLHSKDKSAVPTNARYRLMAWLLSGIDDQRLVQQIRSLPSGYVIVLLTLYYLTKVGFCYGDLRSQLLKDAIYDVFTTT